MAVNLTEGKDLEGSASYVEVLPFGQNNVLNMTIFKRGGLSRDDFSLDYIHHHFTPTYSPGLFRL